MDRRDAVARGHVQQQEVDNERECGTKAKEKNDGAQELIIFDCLYDTFTYLTCSRISHSVTTCPRQRSVHPRASKNADFETGGNINNQINRATHRRPFSPQPNRLRAVNTRPSNDPAAVRRTT